VRLNREFLMSRLLRLRTEPVEAYQVIEAEKVYTVSRMCGLLVVSRLGFYKMAPVPRRRAVAVVTAACRVGRQGR
jgi:hypothetical protein